MADRALWIPEALSRFGVRFVEIDGWQSRGRPGGMVSYRGHLRHHTAGGGSSAAPSLNVCIQGRPDVEGPLCQVLLGRDRVVRIIAAGRCNHAGAGSGCVRYGIPTDRGGWYTTGLEVEHRGTSAEPWTPEMIDASRRVDAAMLWGQAKYGGLDIDGLVRMWGHKEYAPDRKIDPYRLDMDTERTAVGALLRSGGGGTVEDDLSDADVAKIIKHIDDRMNDYAKVAWGFQITNPLADDKGTTPAASLLRAATDRADSAATSANATSGQVWQESLPNPLSAEEGAVATASGLLRVTADHSVQANLALREALPILREIRDALVGTAPAAATDEGKGPGGGG